jgi:hypothetical protein
MNYVPFPSGGGSNWVTERPLQPPDSVVNAVRFMYAGAVLEVVNLVWSVFGIGNATRIVMRIQPTDTASQAHAAAVAEVSGIVAGSLIGAALWLWMARKNAAGRGWARTVATVLFGINTVSTLLVVILLVVTRQGLGGSIIGIAAWVVGLCATFWLWREQSSLYFAEARYRSRLW